MKSVRTTYRGARVRLFPLMGMVALLLLASSASALAERAWRIDSLSNTTAQPGETLEYLVQITNTGDENLTGDPIELVGDLPDGVRALSAIFTDDTRQDYPCFDAADGVSPLAGANRFVCRNSEPLASAVNSDGRPFQVLTLTVEVPVDVDGTLLASFGVSGGGASNSASTVDPTVVSDIPPEFGVDAFDAQVIANAAGDEFTQAGGHPYAATVAIDFNTITNSVPIAGSAFPVEPIKDVSVDIPPGLVGDPTGVDRCTGAQLANSLGFGALPLCPSTSQVGTTLLRLNGFPNTSDAYGPFPVFNMVPPPDVPARFGFNVLGAVVVLDAQVRNGGDYGITVKANNISQALAVAGTSVTLWGVPADPSHDAERACAGRNAPAAGGPSCASGAGRTAFLRNPTSCPVPGVGLVTTARTDSWADPGDFKEFSSESHMPPGYPFPPALMGEPIGTTNCAAVPFDPSFTAQPVVRKTGAPSGFQFDLSIPQTDDPDVIGQADLKRAKVTLPAGVRVSPSSAHGLGACSPLEIDLDSNTLPRCPDSSKIGSAVIDTPLLDTPLRGAVYLARQRDNPFGSLLSIYLVAEGPGVVVKLAGRVDADPLSGQLTATFDDNPQLPFSNLHLEFKGGPTAALVTPKQCGTYTTHAELESWSGKIVAIDTPFEVSYDGRGAPCPGSRFAPGFIAGTADPVAGRPSTLHLRFSRSDEDEEIKAATVNMPNGLTAKIANAELCGEQASKTGACPDASKVGSVTVGAGAGTNPFYIENGRAYITGPYKGAPFGLSIVVPAVAGPFDLGNVVVRSAIYVDKHTAEVRVISDPLPTILEGIPLDVRDVRVAVDKRDFFLNPTNCEEKRISGVLTSVTGSTAPVFSDFQVGECANLGLAPRMRLVVGAPGRTGRGASTPFSTTLRMPDGGANLRSVKVSLPTTINARLPVINRACTRDAYEAGNCAGARAGTAVAKTPLLRDELRGNVYFVKNGRPLPDLFISLRGQVTFDLIGRVSIPGGKRLATTFDAVPDVPVTSFTLNLVPGRQGPVGAATNLCSRRGRTAKAEIDIVGQNGKTKRLDQRLVIRGCGKRAARARRAKRGRRNRRGR